MFKERFLILKMSEGPKSGSLKQSSAPAAVVPDSKEKPKKFNPKKEKDELNKEINDVSVYEKAVKVLESTGLKTAECHDVLGDNTNPYLAMFFDFAERMDEKGWTLDVRNSDRYFAGFKFRGAISGTPDFILKALRWKSIIHPRLKKILGNDYDADLVGVGLVYDFYGLTKVVDAVEYSQRPVTNSVDWALWEIAQLKKGVDPEALVKKERELLKGSKGAALVKGVEVGAGKFPAKYEISEEEVSDKVDEEVAASEEQYYDMKDVQGRLFSEEIDRLDSLVDRVPDPAEMTVDQYEDLQAQTNDILDSVAAKSSEVAKFDSRVKDLLDEVEVLLASGYSSDDIEDAVSDAGLDGEFDRAMLRAKESGDNEAYAAFDLYLNLVGDKIDAMKEYYKAGD